MRSTEIFLLLLLLPTMAKAELPNIKAWHALYMTSSIWIPDLVVEQSSEYKGVKYLGAYNINIPIKLEREKHFTVAVSPIVRYQFGSHTNRTDLGGRVYLITTLDGVSPSKGNFRDMIFLNIEYDRVLERNATSNKFGMGLGWRMLETRYVRTINPDFHRSAYSIGLTFALPMVLSF